MKKKIFTYIFIFMAMFLVLAELTSNIHDQRKEMGESENFSDGRKEIISDSLLNERNDTIWDETEFINE